MGSDRVRAKRKSSSTLTPGFKPKQSIFLQPRYQDRVEAESDSFTENKQQNSSEQANPTLPFLGHSFGRVSVLPIQAKLTIGQPGDKYEQEADRVADQVMRMPEPKIQRVCPECEEELQRQPMEEEEEEETLQTKPLAKQIMPLVQRQAEPMEEEEEEETLQTKTTSGQSPTLSTNLQNRITALRGSGQPLPQSERAFFQPRLGTDFSQVRIHTGSQASETARALNARAFTLGQDIVFGSEQYKHGTTEGRLLLAHELTHTIQQGHASAKSPAIGNLARTSLKISRASSAMVIQRAQVDRVHPATGGGNPFFIYELDNSIDTFSELAQHYGVGRASIQSANPGARPNALRHGQRLNVPAVDPPAVNSRSVGPGAPGLVQSTVTVPVRVRWSSSSSGNLVGRIPRGTSIGLIDSGADIPISALTNKAQGILDELTLRGLADTTTVYAFPPSPNVRSTLTPISNSDVNLIARMIWGEQRSQGTNAMVAAAWIARNRFDAGWGPYSSIITRNQFHGLASPSDVVGLTGPNLVRWTEAQRIAQEVVDGTRPDPTGGVVYFGNGNSVRNRMRTCARRNPAFTWNQISGTNFYYSNGDYTSGCAVP